MDERAIRKVVEQHFRVYEHRQERLPGDLQADLYFLMFPAEEFDRRYAAVRAELHRADPELLVFVRQESGEDILVVMPRPEVPPRKITIHVVLFLLTLATTITGGALLWTGFTAGGRGLDLGDAFAPRPLWMGFLTFSLPLLLILGIHEAAHFIAAKRHGLRATLPYFIPFPPTILPIGTMGAFISLKDPMPDRKALFDVGASGPLAGFAIAVPVLLLGLSLTTGAAMPIPDHGRPEIIVDGTVEDQDRGEALVHFALDGRTTYPWTITPPDDEAWIAEATVRVTTPEETVEQTEVFRLPAGEATTRTLHVPANATEARVLLEWETGIIEFGDPLLVEGLKRLGLGGGEYMTHPTFFAGWVGLLVTGINLLPAGQLDGGHVARAVLGDRMQFAAYGSVALLFVLAFAFNVWLLMALFILMTGIRHPPPLNDRTRLDTKRRVIAALTLLVFAVTFVARPIIV